jgi:hypothetical protein
MSKKHKLFISLALVAVTATAVLPNVAQAVPRYKSEGAFIAEGKKIFVEGWGTLKLQTVIGGTASYTCRNAVGGFVENPTGGLAGSGQTELFTSYQCTFSACPTFPSVLAEELPWKGVLIEPKAAEIRGEIVGVKADLQCWATKAAFEQAARGEAVLPNAKNVFITRGASTCCKASTPKSETGTSANHPGFAEFGPTAGKLEQEGSIETIQGETEGKVKALGYKEAELINTE